MGVIVPAVLPRTFSDLEIKLNQLEGVADAVQIDIVDGKFAAPPTWPYQNDEESFAQKVAAGDMLPHLGKIRFEIDLMVSDPAAVAGMWLSAGATRLTIHAESTTYLPRLLKELQTTYGHDKDFAPDLVSIGIATNIETELGLLTPFLDTIDYIQFMGIARIGHQGEPFDKRVLKKIAIFRKQHPNIPIQVDGGVSKETAPLLLSAGVSRLIVGSDLWNAKSLQSELAALEALVPQYGLYA